MSVERLALPRFCLPQIEVRYLGSRAHTRGNLRYSGARDTVCNLEVRPLSVGLQRRASHAVGYVPVIRACRGYGGTGCTPLCGVWSSATLCCKPASNIM